MNRLQLALDYHIKNDWTVIPLYAWDKYPKDKPDSAGKAALVPWREYQTTKPTEEQIVQWFEKTDSNIGIITGKLSNLSIIDVDTEDSDIINSLKLPPTYMVKSRKGYHFYYNYNERVDNGDVYTPSGKHVGEFRSEGGIIVAAGSKHKTKFIYKALNDLPVVDFPTHLLSTQRTHKQDYKKIFDGIEKGNRTNAAKSWIGEVVRVHYPNKQKTWDIVINLNNNNKPALPESQIKSITTYCWEQEEFKKDKNKKVLDGYNLITLGDLMLETADPYPHIIEDLIKKQSLNMIVGPTGCGKSLFVLKIVDALTTGKPFLDKFSVVKSKCLILDLEMTRDDCIVRAKDVSTPGNDCLILCEKSWRVDNKDHFQWLKDKITENNIDVVVLDTFSKIHLVDENSNSAITVVMALLMEICNEFKVTMIIMHHVNKSIDAKGLAKGRGASAIPDNVGGYLTVTSTTLHSAKGDPYLLMTVVNDKIRRAGGKGSFTLSITNKKKEGRTHFEYVSKVDEVLDGINKAKDEVYNVIKENEGLIKSELHDKLKKSECSIREINSGLKLLIDEDVAHIDKSDNKGHKLCLGPDPDPVRTQLNLDGEQEELKNINFNE